MIISSSRVGMSSNRQYTYYEQKESLVLREKAGQAIKLDLSDEAKSLSGQMKEYQFQKREEQERRQQENLQKMIERGKIAGKEQPSRTDGPKTKDELIIEMLRKLVEALQRGRKGNFANTAGEIKKIQSDYKKALASPGLSSAVSVGISSSVFVSAGASASLSISAGNGQSAGFSVGGNVWTKTTVTSAFVSEAEHTAFESVGMAKTADGREIQFGVSVEMSRAFCAKYESYTQENYILTDPLVINLDSNVASVSDMKFLFDLDADGKKEEVSFAGSGSGFLALDRNDDGKVNDGSELFGTKSGDGFADLSAFDEDGNGWIDEADSVFKDLKIWTKEEDGKDVLLDLKKADVGAIYLGNANTEFSLKSEDNLNTNAIIRKTGIYLKESGGVGTLQHVDLAV